MLNELPEEMYTLVDSDGRPVYSDAGMDGNFSVCTTLGDMMTFTRKMGWSQMHDMASWSQKAAQRESYRIPVFPAKVNISFEKIQTEQ
jgi:hypothetical protein